MDYNVDEESPTVVAIVVDENRNSQYALKWALQKFVPQGINLFKLLYVIPRTFTSPVQWKTDMVLFPYKQMCSQRQVEAECHIIETDDVADGIAKEIVRFAINKLVVGSSSQSVLSRWL